MSDFRYSASQINDIIKRLELSPVCMVGVKNDLQKLKSVIEKVYDENIFYLNYWETDAPYFGWRWSEDDGSMENQKRITEGITDKFKEIYALILAGLGEQCKEIEETKGETE